MDLSSKAKELGILTEFVDAQNRRRETDPVALKNIVEALPPRAPRPFLSGSVVIRSGHPTRTELGQAAKLPLRWQILRDAELVANGVATDRSIAWPPALPAGSYRLHLIDASGAAEDVPLVVAPPKAFGGKFDRCWLLAVQLYGVRSARNFGIGDFKDLQGLIELAVAWGADGVGLNPLHVLFDDRPSDCSPYSPNSRLFLNPLYIDVEQLGGFEVGALAEKDDVIARLRASDIVDYGAVAELKWQCFRSAFDAFRADASNEAKADFTRFCAQRAPVLRRFACFEVLRHKFNKAWWEWPQQWCRPDDAKLHELGHGPDADEIELIEFVQWNADRQLQACSNLATELGMKVGLYLDVAVGVQSDGFDAWNEQVAISRDLAVGAPPDSLNTAGQDWGLAGFNAAGLEIESFEPFRQMLRASMRHAGAIRLDHVLGLNRLYLIPRGFGPDNGAYIQMPFEALLAVTALESVARDCVVIGEDLGTVPEGFCEHIADWGIWSYKVMMFERDDRGNFRNADDFASNALVTFSTHDLSTYAGWRSFADLKLKKSLGIDPGETDEARWHALTKLDEVLHRHGIERHDVYAVIKLLSRSRSRLLAVSLEDLLGAIDQPNVPGTVNEHPNWRRRLPASMENIGSAIDIAALKDATAERRGTQADGLRQTRR